MELWKYAFSERICFFLSQNFKVQLLIFNLKISNYFLPTALTRDVFSKDSLLLLALL